MNNSLLGISAAIISAMSWALCSVIFKKLTEKLEPVAMTFVKAVISSFFIFVLIVLTHSNLDIGINNIFAVAISGILGIAIGDSLFFASLSRLSPLVLSIILFVFPYFLSGLFGVIFLKEIPSISDICAIFAIITGVAFLVFPVNKNDNNIKTKISGVILGILSVICTVYSMVILKPVLITCSSLTVTMYRMAFSAFAIFLFGLFSKKIFIWKDILIKDKIYSLKLSGTVTIATLGGFWLSLVAIKHSQLVVASSLMSIEPFFILLFMILFYKYIPKKKEFVGIFVILVGIILLCLG